MKKTKIYIVEDYRLIRATYKHFFASVENLEVLGDFGTAEDCILLHQVHPRLRSDQVPVRAM